MKTKLHVIAFTLCLMYVATAYSQDQKSSELLKAMQICVKNMDYNSLMLLCNNNNQNVIVDSNTDGFPIVFSLLNTENYEELKFIIGHYYDEENNIFVDEYGGKKNPLYYAMQMNNFDLFKMILTIDSSILYNNTAIYENGNWTYPIMHMAVFLNKFEYVDYVIMNKYYDINYVYYPDSRMQNNILSGVSNIKMREYLLDKKINIGYVSNGTYYCTDDRVRIRTLPFTDSEIIGYCSKNDIVTLLQKSYFAEAQGYGFGRWYQIKTIDGLVGWSFGSYYKEKE